MFLNKMIETNTSLDLKYLELEQEEINYICKNIDKFINLTKDLIYLKEITKSDTSAYNKVCNYINTNPKIIVDSIYTRLYTDSGVEKSNQKLKDILYLIIDDVCKNENINISEVTYLATGGYSTIIGVGTKVIKVGEGRGTDTFPKNPYIIEPLLRKNIRVDDESIFVEVTEKVDVESVTDEDAYKLYSSLRDIGLIWTDADKRNVGRLIKDNVIHWNESLPVDEESLNLGKARGSVILKKGQPVILDADFIYDEKDPNIRYGSSKEKYESYEDRYQREKEFEMVVDIPEPKIGHNRSR